VLWSPVGAPAGVPGPRRNADDCDAGWFAPVATRRRPIFGAFQAPSPQLAVFPGGTTPPEPPDGAPRPVGCQLRPSLWSAPPGGPEGRFGGRRNVLAADAPLAPAPLALLSSRCFGKPATWCVRTALSQVTRLQRSHGGAPRALQPTAGRMCPPWSSVAMAGGCPAGESCRRLGQPRASRRKPVRSGRWVSWARSSVRAQLTQRPPNPPPPAPSPRHRPGRKKREPSSQQAVYL